MFVFILVTRVQPQFPLKEGIQSRVVYMESEALRGSCIHVWLWDSCRKLSNGSRTAKVTCVVCFHFCFVELRIKPWSVLVWKRPFIYWKATCQYIYICIDWESWCRTQSDMIFLYLKKDLLFNVCVCFHFFFLLLWVCVRAACEYLHVCLSICSCMCGHRWAVQVGFLHLSLYILFLRQGLSSEPVGHWLH